MSRQKAKTRILDKRPAGPDHQVVTVTAEGGTGAYCRQPCPECPWRRENAGSFPPEAFEHSATTAYDMAQNVFACHVAGIENSMTCAGFLLRGADHNLRVRLGRIHGRFLDVTEGDADLYENYREMAEDNGVDPDSEILAPCR